LDEVIRRTTSVRIFWAAQYMEMFIEFMHFPVNALVKIGVCATFYLPFIF